MALLKKIKQNENLVRIGSAVALGVIALRSFVKGKRLRGLAAAGGAVAVGSTASTLEPTPLEIERESESTTEEGVTGSTIEEGAMQCQICDDPIVPGQSRRPNENDDIAHEACL